jgi:hypothetical protein
MANDLDDLDGAENGPQPAEDRELVIVDLRHPTIMPPPLSASPLLLAGQQQVPRLVWEPVHPSPGPPNRGGGRRRRPVAASPSGP